MSDDVHSAKRFRSGRCRRPLHFHRHWLLDLTERMFENLDGNTVATVRCYARDLDYPWGSGCSGTDSPAWAMEAISSYFGRHGILINAPHRVSAEIIEAKRRFICIVAGPAQLFEDNFHLASGRKHLNHMTGLHEVCDPRGEIKVWFFGFSCKSVSGLNAANRLKSTAVDDMDSTTGRTLWSVLLVLERRRHLRSALRTCSACSATINTLKLCESLSERGTSCSSGKPLPANTVCPRLGHACGLPDGAGTCLRRRQCLCMGCSSSATRRSWPWLATTLLWILISSCLETTMPASWSTVLRPLRCVRRGARQRFVGRLWRQ